LTVTNCLRGTPGVAEFVAAANITGLPADVRS
jgi:hypothetical protein